MWLDLITSEHLTLATLFYPLFQRIKAAYDLKEGDPLLHAFQNEFEAHWQRMLKFMDENKDGQLSVDEWMDYYPK